VKVSTTPAANLQPVSDSVVYIGGKFATSTNDTGVNDTGGKFAICVRNHQWPAMAEFSLHYPVWIAEINITACNSVTMKEHFIFIAGTSCQDTSTVTYPDPPPPAKYQRAP
jgi:hypothetical protein